MKWWLLTLHGQFSWWTWIIPHRSAKINQFSIFETYLSQFGKLDMKRRTEMRAKWSPCLIILAVVFLAFIASAFGICGIMIFVTITTKFPTFFVEKIILNTSMSHPEYYVTVYTKNPNTYLGLNYWAAGETYLMFKQKDIATGIYYPFYQKSGETKALELALDGPEGHLPRGLQRSLQSMVSVTLSFAIVAPVTLKFGVLQTWPANMNIFCNLRVDSLGNGTRILNQECAARI